MKLLDFILYRARRAAVIAPILCASFYLLMFWLSDTYRMEVLPEYMSSREQLVGLMLVLILISTFLVSFVIVAQRRSMRFGQELVDNHVLDERPEDWLRPVRRRSILIGSGLGIFYGLALNTPLPWIIDFFEISGTARSTVIGQALLWTIVGVALSLRLSTAYAFYKVGKTVDAKILDTSVYGPFARNGMDDVLAIVVLLVLSTVQALDAQFRLGNYLATLLVALPAAAFLFLLPMFSIHHRIAEARDANLERVEREIASMPTPQTAGDLQKLEILLQHRDRVRDTLLWPINRSVTSRLAVYVIIPPIAWLGAAFVEFGVGRIMNGP